MGCLKNFLRAIVITLAVIGFLAIGGKEFIVKYLKQWFNPTQIEMMEKAKKVGDFSNISEEFEIEKAAGIMGYNAVVAEHKASGQKMFVIDSGKKYLITQEDLQSENIEEKLINTAHKFKYQSVSAENIKVVKKGSIHTFGEDVPYVKFEAKISKLPVGEVSGIISAAKNKDGDARTLISVNEKNKYSQLISDEFFKKIK